MTLASECRSRPRLQFTSAPLEGKTFFLHVQSASKARELERKLKELGGVSTEINVTSVGRGAINGW